MAPLIISSARGQSRAPKPRPPRLLVPDDVETITFLCPCARSQCRDILANLWITYHSSPPASLQKQATKKEIFVLTRRLCTNVVPEGIDNHKGTSWEPCQADATGLITRDIAQISIGETFLIAAQAIYLAHHRQLKAPCRCRRCRGLDRRPLLKLPAELRNKIYRLVLVFEKPISVRSSWRQPHLLRVNKQIREEASSIYYIENTFSITLSDFNCVPYRRFILRTDINRFYEKLPAVPQYEMWTTAMSWGNLEWWLFLYYRGQMPAIASTAGYHHLRMKVVPRAFKIVSQLRAEGMIRGRIHPVLLEFKEAVEEQANGAWVWV